MKHWYANIDTFSYANAFPCDANTPNGAAKQSSSITIYPDTFLDFIVLDNVTTSGCFTLTGLDVCLSIWSAKLVTHDSFSVLHSYLFRKSGARQIKLIRHFSIFRGYELSFSLYTWLRIMHVPYTHYNRFLVFVWLLTQSWKPLYVSWNLFGMAGNALVIISYLPSRYQNTFNSINASWPPTPE